MKKTILLISLLLTFSLIGCSCTFHSGLRGNGNTTTKRFNVSEFSNIDASHAFDIDVVVGETQSVKIRADENLMQYLKVYVKNNTLILGLKNNTNINDDIDVIISVESLDEIELSGACKIDVQGIEANKFTIDMSGACKGTLSGSTRKLDIDLSGATKLNTVDLIAKDVIVDVSGASKCSVYSSISISAKASGVSKIVIYGDPSDINTDVSGISKITSK